MANSTTAGKAELKFSNGYPTKGCLEAFCKRYMQGKHWPVLIPTDYATKPRIQYKSLTIKRNVDGFVMWAGQRGLYFGQHIEYDHIKSVTGELFIMKVDKDGVPV